jgi:hypothetical protein
MEFPKCGFGRCIPLVEEEGSCHMCSIKVERRKALTNDDELSFSKALERDTWELKLVREQPSMLKVNGLGQDHAADRWILIPRNMISSESRLIGDEGLQDGTKLAQDGGGLERFIQSEISSLSEVKQYRITLDQTLIANLSRRSGRNGPTPCLSGPNQKRRDEASASF